MLECASCLDVLKDPKAFSCLHSFCLCCLENTVEFSNKLVLLHHALKRPETSQNMSKLTNLDDNVCPFVDAARGDNRSGQVQDGFVHVRIQQRKGRKTLTTIQGLKAKHDLLKAIVKAFKKEFACGVQLIQDPEHGKVLQLQGDQRTKVCAWLSDPKKGLVRADQLKMHGF